MLRSAAPVRVFAQGLVFVSWLNHLLSTFSNLESIMNRKTLIAFAATTMLSVGLLGAYGGAASARTLHASAGLPFPGSQPLANWTAWSNGVARNVAGTGTWEMPVPLDFNGAKSITVRAKVNAGSTMSCQAI